MAASHSICCYLDATVTASQVYPSDFISSAMCLIQVFTYAYWDFGKSQLVSLISLSILRTLPGKSPPNSFFLWHFHENFSNFLLSTTSEIWGLEWTTSLISWGQENNGLGITQPVDGRAGPSWLWPWYFHHCSILPGKPQCLCLISKVLTIWPLCICSTLCPLFSTPSVL